jgi:DNA-binding transcriptional ArsR family regulator
MSHPSPPPVTSSAPLFAALGDDTRLAILGRLSAAGPLSITRLTEGSGVTRQAVTKHLEVLAAARLVHDSKHGRQRIWELDGRQLLEASRLIREMSARWDERVARLRALVEDPTSADQVCT